MKLYEDFKEKYSNILFNKYGHINSQFLRGKNKSIKILDLMHTTSHFPESITVQQRLLAIKLDIYEWPSCKVCGNPVSNIMSSTCSVKCSRDPRSGVYEKAKLTNLKKYGTTCYFTSKENIEKLSKNGRGLANPKTKEKIKQTNLQRYGVENVFANPDIKEKIKETHNKKYGGNFHTVALGNKLDKLQDADYCRGLADQFCMSTICEMLGVASNTVYKYFERHGITHFHSSRSNQEVEIVDFIQSLGITNMIVNDRQTLKPFEIDVLLPDFGVGIEMNGVYWHSEKAGCRPNYHLEKKQKALEKNINLIQVFENEWVMKQNLVKSRIRSILGLNEHKIPARKCKIKLIENTEKTKFLNENHLQGNCKSSVNLGLYFENNLVACMTFAKTRFDKSADYEMMRFCSLQNTTVTGAFQKLLKYFRSSNSFPSIVSYADLRWGNGDVYKNNGFQQIAKSKPSYFYFKGSSLVLENRMNYQKGRLAKMLPETFDANLSEWDNMKKAGYNRIWDCGTSKWIIK